jgi:hypothetical protein
MINIRPRQGNSSKNVLNPDTRKEIIELVSKVVHG